jgi:hypothetical protein
MVEGSDGKERTILLDPNQARVTIRRLALIAILGVGLGFVMQALVIAARLLGGGAFPGITIFADLVQTVTWSVLVCTGVAIGVSVSKARKALAGLMGMLFAPLALAVAKAGQKAMLALIGAIEQPAALSLATVGVVRAFEYGLLAWLLALLTEKEVIRPGPYLGIGAAIGVTFGSILFWLTYSATIAEGAQLAMPQILGMLVNEIGAPAGCAFLIYIGQLAGHSFTVLQKHRPTTPTAAGSPPPAGL